MSQARFLFEYPSVGRDVVSQSAPGANRPTYGPDPEVCPYEGDSGSDSEDYESEDELGEPHLDWHPHAINFLAEVPQDDATWSRYLNTNGEVRSLCHRLRLPFLYPGFRKDFIDWGRLFAECKWHLARACENPPLASLFSLIFIAACHVALVDGCPREIVFAGIRECVRQCGIWEYELTEPMLDRLREGAVKGIMILTEYARVVGARAHEIPIHTPNCFQLFIRCTPACITFVKSRIPFTYRPTTPLQSDCLEIPSLVYDILGGSSSKWEYRDICEILQPEGVPMPLYRSICMGDVLEYDENDDEGMSDFDGPVYEFKEEYACSFPHPMGMFRESFQTPSLFL
ncbi:hypothetical protein MRS44_004454 [Fusarium solani]|uniref:Uncharacterized protein n=1 Tax=Fusarium solani TaxID=169388 RepID=A0A9P9L0A7_FUSSL|nr:uncharacterized protein B0J15DRAFT_576985 [Fusarium solani]KAH7271801.1 hypothetical protein B0J15DRAFT_576985 [Fusarium solani]KAJ3466890.1 hypothetical protein MRS44_004454 [Fusarium solani]